MKLRGFALLTLTSCGIAWAAAPDAAMPPLSPIVAGEKTSGPHAAAFAPLAYFNANCARCHGENGSFYQDDFAHDKSDAELREVIDEMAAGPGQAPLAPAELDAVAAWHRALRDKKTFVLVVKSEKTDAGFQLSGEISPGAALEINGKTVEVKGSNWTASVAPGAAQLRATKGDATTELDANAAAWAPQEAHSTAE